MDARDSNFDRDILPVVRAYAAKRFARDSDRLAKIADAVSVAWENFQTASDRATIGSLVRFAALAVIHGRQFRESERSITGPNRHRATKPERSDCDPADVARVGDDPAEIGALRVDFPQWLETLEDRDRQVCLALIDGHSTSEAAEKFGVSLGRISQLRKELLTSWVAFTA